MPKLEKITKKEIINANNCSEALIDQITNHAKHSFYRSNAGSADLYSFTIDNKDPNKRGYLFSFDPKNPPKRSWRGGWDWSDNVIFTDEQYTYNMSENQFYQIIH